MHRKNQMATKFGIGIHYIPYGQIQQIPATMLVIQ